MSKKLPPLTWSAILVALFCSVLLAQAEPLVKFPPGDFSCTITVTPRNVPKPETSQSQQGVLPVVERIEITQIGKIRRDYVVMSDKSVSQLWSLVDKGLSVQELVRGTRKDIYVLQGKMRTEASPRLLHFDPESVSWITPTALVINAASPGTILHYQAKVIVKEKQEISDDAFKNTIIPAETATYQAWIDAKTLLPLRFDDAEAMCDLKFSAAPPGPLVIPPDLRAKLDRWVAALGPRPHR